MSSNTGAGGAPFGTQPYGFGTPAVAPTPGGTINRLSNGTQTGSPKISLALGSRGQYTFDEFGRRSGQPDSEHMVTLALGTVRGTCVVPEVGHRFREIRKVTEAFEQEIKTRVDEALSPITERDLVTVDDVRVDPQNGAPSGITVHLTDNATGAQIQQLI